MIAKNHTFVIRKQLGTVIMKIVGMSLVILVTIHTNLAFICHKHILFKKYLSNYFRLFYAGAKIFENTLAKSAYDSFERFCLAYFFTSINNSSLELQLSITFANPLWNFPEYVDPCLPPYLNTTFSVF